MKSNIYTLDMSRMCGNNACLKLPCATWQFSLAETQRQRGEGWRAVGLLSSEQATWQHRRPSGRARTRHLQKLDRRLLHSPFLPNSWRVYSRLSVSTPPPIMGPRPPIPSQAPQQIIAYTPPVPLHAGC